MDMIDAHQHYWHPRRGDYDWMPMDDATLARPYHPADLAPMLDRHGISRTVLVQAAATVFETEYMLGIADATPSVAAVVGWIDFEKPSDRAHLERLAEHPRFSGVRPMIQDIADDDWMLRDDIAWAYEALIDLDLTFDALGFPRHLENFYKILTHHREMRVVIDHCMKPQIRSHSVESFAHWADGMRAIAEDTNACCKLSGIVTESDGWTLDRLEPYARHVLDVFGPDRVMWGSDWPVCQLEASYDDWREAAKALTDHLSPSAKEAVFGGTAARFYRI
ncbi:amidohydrolase family protein [Roseibacterium sp. SDUM158017]|uniref:amidohydrolase family protein n=1 Tax=Roseicyclus salinarum TaxID=3036773 RepID=UPI002415537B|nr:amidohydrolase family protein [Roseibacterium sp. SDUM158017]MDG4649549.1 amidohydrolase family protein [Roseibacterium sp. SDUM158017]